MFVCQPCYVLSRRGRLANDLNERGLIHYKLVDFTHAFEDYSRSIEYSKDCGSCQKILAAAHFNRATVSYRMSEFTDILFSVTCIWVTFNFRSIWWSSQRHGKGYCLGTIQPRVPGRSSRDEGSSRRAATDAISTELTCFFSQPVDCSFKSVEIVVNDQYKTRFQVWLTNEVTEKIKRNETKNTKQETGFMIQGSVPLASKWQRNNNSTIKHVFNLFHNASFHAQIFHTVVPIVFHSVGVAFGTLL